ncbi:MAG: MFS transporter [Treponemataceae bacterium]
MRSWKTVYISILVAETLAIAGFGTSMPVIPIYLQDMGMHDQATLKFWSGLIQSVSAIMMAVTSPIWGSLADSRGRRMMLLRALFGGAIFVGLMAFATEPWQLLVLRALQGAVTGTVAAATVLVAGIVPAAQLGVTLGLLQTGVSVGNSIGPLIGGVISDFLGRPAAFIATALMLIAGGIIIMKGVDSDTRKPAEGEQGKIRMVPDFRTVLSSPILPSLMLVTMAIQAATAIPMPMLPLFIQEITPDSTLVGSTTGIVLGAGAAASAVAAAFIGRISNKLGYAKTLFLCLSGGALMTVPQAFAANPLQLTLIRVVSMLLLGGAIPTVQALIASNAPKDKQGAIFGLNTSVAAIGMAIGPVIGSGVAAIFDFRAVFIAGGIMLGATVAVMRVVAPRVSERTSRY